MNGSIWQALELADFDVDAPVEPGWGDVEGADFLMCLTF
jgi:hypothetical protein